MRVPMLHIHTVASGGGSILRYEDGRFRVGTQSAGADPGPACYGRGDEVTVTGTRGDKYLEMTISNPVAEGEKRARSGNKMALANVRQRFELAYGNRAAVTVEESGDRYTVSLAFPIGDAA